MANVYSEIGITIHSPNDVIESVGFKGLEVSLIASGDGSELIRHRLKAGAQWAMGPMDNWAAMEYVYIVSGKMRWTSPTGEMVLQAGQTISALSIQQDAFFVADENTEFLYFCSQPVFHMYSQSCQELMGLAVSIEVQDGYTSDHCDRIKSMAVQVGREMGLSSQQLFELNMGGFLHDVGKIQVPRDILCKPGKLTPDEWSVMKQHTTFGREILDQRALPSFVEAGRIVEQHHERFDGSGYPYGLSGANIEVGALIVAVVDSFDAMTTDRPYQKGRPTAEAADEILRGRGVLYDPYVTDVFLSCLDKFDINSIQG